MAPAANPDAIRGHSVDLAHALFRRIEPMNTGTFYRRALTILLVATSFAIFVAAEFSQDNKAAQPSANGDWLYGDHNIAGTRYSPLTQINRGNVNQLEQACSYTFPEKVPAQTAPIVSGGVMYVTSAHYTVALDGFDCRVLWTHEWKPRDNEHGTMVNRGAAIADGKIIRGTIDDYLIALDAKDGHLLWAKQIADPAKGYFISMLPLVHGGLVYIGPAGSEYAAPGFVGAYRVSNGEQVWKFNIVPQDGDGEPGAETWGPDPEARKHGGGCIWTPLSYDVEKDLLYVPGGNPAPDTYLEVRPGLNLYTNSIIALNGKTGRLVWYRQLVPNDFHDYDLLHAAPIIKTGSRTLIATSGKDGVLRVLDRDSHKILYSAPFTTLLNQDVPLSTTTPVRVCPGHHGGNQWNGGAFSPKLNLLFVPSVDNHCSDYIKYAEPPPPERSQTAGGYWGGKSTIVSTWDESRGRVTAFDPLTGKERWRYEAQKPIVAGLTVTASDLIFTGEMDGQFDVLDAQSGTAVYRQDLKDSIQGGVMTYLAHDVQNVAVVHGMTSLFKIKEIVGGNPTVTVFRIGKKKPEPTTGR
jgi:alcohol dehydrogenase (cytochrome c)